MSPRVERVEAEDTYQEGFNEQEEQEMDIDLPGLVDLGNIHQDESDDEDTDDDEHGRMETHRMVEEERNNNTGNNNEEADEIIFLHNNDNHRNNNNNNINNNGNNNNAQQRDNHDNQDIENNINHNDNYDIYNHESGNSNTERTRNNATQHNINTTQQPTGVQQGHSMSTTGYQRIMNRNQPSNKIMTNQKYSVQDQLNLLLSKLSYIQTTNSENKPIRKRSKRSLRNHDKQARTKQMQRTTKHQRRHDQLYDKITSQTRSEELLQYWGNPLRRQTNWPIINKNNTFRIASVNINGINSNNNYLELEAIVGQMMEYQIDILCLTEVNLDVHKPQVYHDIWNVMKKLDPHIDINMKTSKQKSRIANSTFKPGGTMIITSSAWSGRRIRDYNEPKSQDKFGRWTTTHLRGQEGKKVSIINWYRVIDDRHNTKAINTIYLQQLNDLERAYKRVMDPRKSITKDLENYIRDLATRGHTIILTGDTNEHLQAPNNVIQKMLDDLNMDNIMIEYHPEIQLPTTYDRGENCLDIIAGTKDVTAMTQSTGYLPFYEPFCTDHRVGYIDLDKTKIFGILKNDTTKAFFHGFNTKNVRKCDQYLHALEDQFETHQIFNKVQDLKSQVNNYLTDETATSETKEHLILQIQQLEKIRSELMLGAEAKCRTKKYAKQFKFSGKLVTAAKQLWTIKKIIRQIRLGTLQCTEAEMAQTNYVHKQVLLNLRMAQRSSYQFRVEMMDELATKLSQQWKVAHSSAVKMINNAEASALLFATVTRTMKPGRKGNIQYVLTNTAEAQEGQEKDWKIIDDQDTLNKTIIQQNSTHLLKSTQSITAKGKLQRAIGWQSEKEQAVQEILSGQHEEHIEDKPSPELKEFMKGLTSPIDQANMETQMTWNFGISEYKKLFGKTRESTACGPSGLHMSHWKAAIERDRIAEIHAFFIWAAFTLGFSYHRWQVSWHCMLQKRNKPYIHRLRIIQLFEGDFNGGLKYLLGRKLMQHMVNHKLIPPETYGSIPGRNAIEAMKLLQLFYENHRLLKRDMAIVFNDADGCYDRIRPNMVDLTMRRLGLPKSIATAHTDAQIHMRHHIKTANGISRDHIQWAPQPDTEMQPITTKDGTKYVGNIGGLGQGGGGGPVGWLSIIIVIIEAYKQLATHASLHDPMGRLTFTLYVLSYVDDNSLLMSLNKTQTIEDILELVKRNLDTWKTLLQLTGGDLSLGKCTFSLMKWDHQKQQLHTKQTLPGDLIIDNIKLKRIEINEADRQLGIRVAIDGKFKDEYEYRLDRAYQLGKRVLHSNLTPVGAQMAYSIYYKPMIEYPLSLTTFSDRECDKIHSKFVHRCLPKMGFNRHMPRVVIFGPKKYGGMNYFDLKLQQLHMHLKTMKGHMRRGDQVGNAIKANINALQLLSGSADNILHQDPSNFPYIDNHTSLEYIWKQSYKYQFRIHYNIDIPEAYFIHDLAIMDIARSKRNLTTQQLISINTCRLYYKVIYLGDMATYDGLFIKKEYITRGQGQPRRNKIQLDFPCPEQWQWKTWIEFILGTFVNGDMSLAHQIGLRTRITTTIPMPSCNKFNAAKKYISNIYQELTGNYNIPHDNGQSMITALMEKRLHGASDGSWKESLGIGTWGYVISPHGLMTDNLDTVQYGHGNCLLHDNTNAQTAEHYGAIGVLIFLHTLALTHSLTQEECKGIYIIIWIDNSEVHRRFNTKPQSIKVGNYVLADRELWTMIHTIKQALPFTVVSQWVKGHQDRHDEFNNLPFNSQLNILADKSAELQYARNDPYVNTKHLHKEGVIYYRDTNGKEITDTYKYIQHTQHGQGLKEYVQRKQNWQERETNSIDWNNLEGTLNKLTLSTLAQRCKMMHGWQNTGTQKKVILESKKTYDEWDEDVETVIQCPMCKQPEQQLHYTLCSHETMITMRTKEIQKLQKALKKIDTYEGIIAIWTKSANQYPKQITTVQTNNIDKVVQTAIHNQQHIGWHNLLKGFISVNWSKVQQIYINEQQLEDNPQWASKAIEILQSYTLTMWQYRNNYLHGIDIKENRQIRLEQTKSMIQSLYANHDRMHIPLQDKTFDLPIQERLESSLTAQIAWIELATRRIRMHREEATKNTLDRWLVDKQTQDSHRLREGK